jgi:hypothetical protein
MTLASCWVVSVEGLSTEVKQFLRDHIQSIEQLEILALMRPQPEREWTAKAIYEAILSNERSIESRLQIFVEKGLLAAAVGDVAKSYRYAPRGEQLDQMVQGTLQAYRERRVMVIETIFRPEQDPAQSFADAFRFKQP